MNREQKHTPKYWIGHDTKQDDVLLQTARKSRIETCEEMAHIFGWDWAASPHLKVELIECRLLGDVCDD
jgi:hypothetical protein